MRSTPSGAPGEGGTPRPCAPGSRPGWGPAAAPQHRGCGAQRRSPSLRRGSFGLRPRVWWRNAFFLHCGCGERGGGSGQGSRLRTPPRCAEPPRGKEQRDQRRGGTCPARPASPRHPEPLRPFFPPVPPRRGFAGVKNPRVYNLFYFIFKEFRAPRGAGQSPARRALGTGEEPAVIYGGEQRSYVFSVIQLLFN